MSWFTSSIADIKNKVQAAIPIDDELIEKLTLTTPELTAEREQIDSEEKRKEDVRDYLAEILPWETRDEEREILVEECRESVLALSSKEETFLGPYELPGGRIGAAEEPANEEEGTGKGEDEGGAGTSDGEGKGQRGEPPGQEKLSKLEPLPPLLADFDLDTHVGLIQRLLEVDPNLVEMHSQLSGAGEKERTFWRNYFFHCAWARYEAGLSIDEIWARKPSPPPTEEHRAAASVAAAGGAKGEGETPRKEEEEEETMITFEPSASPDDSSAASEKSGSVPATAAAVGAPSSPSASPTANPIASTGAETSPSGSASGTDYEMIGDSSGGEAGSVGGVDEELDELEAEIARELED